MNEYYQNNYPQSRLEDKIIKVPDIYIETNMFLNLGKEGVFHMSFPDSEKEKDMIFSGIIYEAAKDHVMVFNTHANEWYLLPLLYLNYVVFIEKPITPISSSYV